MATIEYLNVEKEPGHLQDGAHLRSEPLVGRRLAGDSRRLAVVQLRAIFDQNRSVVVAVDVGVVFQRFAVQMGFELSQAKRDGLAQLAIVLRSFALVLGRQSFVDFLSNRNRTL